MLIDEIRSECWHLFILIIIIACGILLCDIANREAVWNLKYQNWTFNTNCPLPDGFSRAMIDPDKCD